MGEAILSIFFGGAQAASLHQELNVAKTEVHRMRSKIHEQTQKIMDIPRLEEACFRAARGLGCGFYSCMIFISSSDSSCDLPATADRLGYLSGG